MYFIRFSSVISVFINIIFNFNDDVLLTAIKCYKYFFDPNFVYCRTQVVLIAKLSVIFLK